MLSVAGSLPSRKPIMHACGHWEMLIGLYSFIVSRTLWSLHRSLWVSYAQCTSATHVSPSNDCIWIMYQIVSRTRVVSKSYIPFWNMYVHHLMGIIVITFEHFLEWNSDENFANVASALTTCRLFLRKLELIINIQRENNSSRKDKLGCMCTYAVMQTVYVLSVNNMFGIHIS